MIEGKEKQKIMDKLQKLLAAQGEGAVNPNEIATANKVMKKLMEKYDIEMHQLEKIKSKESNVSESHYDTLYKRPRNWVKLLAATVADFYDCKCLRSRGIFYFLGFEIDRKIAIQVFDYLYWAIHYEGEKEFNLSEANDFRAGATYQLGKRFEKMKDEMREEMVSESTALIVLKESEIKKYEEEEHPHVTSESVNSGNITEGFFNGIAYGKTVGLNQQVSGK